MEKPQKTIFGENVKKCREAHQMTQSQLAKKVNITPQSISAYEKGEKSPSIEIAAQLAIALDVSLDDLCGIQAMPSKRQKEKDAEWVYGLLNLLVNPPTIRVICNEAGDTEEDYLMRLHFHRSNYVSIDFNGDEAVEFLSKVGKSIGICDDLPDDILEAYMNTLANKYASLFMPGKENKGAAKPSYDPAPDIDGDLPF